MAISRPINPMPLPFNTLQISDFPHLSSMDSEWDSDADSDADAEIESAELKTASRVRRRHPFLNTPELIPISPIASTPFPNNRFHHDTPFYSTVVEPNSVPSQRLFTQWGFQRALPCASRTVKEEQAKSPSRLHSMTIHLSTTYSHQQGFHYNPQQKPRRVLTQPSKPGMNDGYDNENCDYILWVNDILGDTAEHQYRVIDLLGFGTYGQVVKCEHLSTGKTVSVKVIKNKAAYRQQSRIEVDILTKLKEKIDKNDSKRILKLLHTFVHKNHFCMVFELLSYNIYQVLKQNQFRGFSMDLIRVFTLQLLDTLVVLKESKIIHCDLKPENMLLKSLDSPTIKVIDFGASCYENNPILMYIQSRYYRAPEIIIGAKYSSAIDMWSLGCIVAELFLGTPIFPGNSEYNQIYRITDLLGLPPPELLATGKSTSRYFNHYNQSYGPPIYRLKSREQYAKEQSVHEMEGKKYYTHTTLEDILMNHREYPSALNEQERQRELQTRRALVDFLKHTLVLDPLLRWRPHEARLHPFITGEPMDEDSLPSSVCSSPIIKTSLTSVKENHASKSTHSLSLAANTVEESKHSTNTHLPVMITEPLPPMNYVGVSEPTLSLSKGKEKPNMRGTWRFSYHHLRPSLLGSFTEKKLMRAYKASEK